MKKLEKRVVMKKLIAFAMIAGMVGSSSVNIFAMNKNIMENKSKQTVNSYSDLYISEAINETGYYIYNKNQNPGYGNEWNVLGLSRSELDIPKSYSDSYYSSISNGVNFNNPTDCWRVIIGLTAIGKDASNVNGNNLLEKVTDFNYVKGQGLNSLIFALIAIDSNNYDIPSVEGVSIQTTRNLIIDEILDKELSGGGWAFFGSEADPDMTAMTLQALAKYKDNEKIKPAIDRALEVLSNMQKSNGGYESWGTINLESIAQVVVALTELGINPQTDKRFIKDQGILDAMMEFYVSGGGFKHTMNDKRPNSMATEQGMYALVAYERFVKGKTSLYDMTDINN